MILTAEPALNGKIASVDDWQEYGNRAHRPASGTVVNIGKAGFSFSPELVQATGPYITLAYSPSRKQVAFTPAEPTTRNAFKLTNMRKSAAGSGQLVAGRGFLAAFDVDVDAVCGRYPAEFDGTRWIVQLP